MIGTEDFEIYEQWYRENIEMIATKEMIYRTFLLEKDTLAQQNLANDIHWLKKTIQKPFDLLKDIDLDRVEKVLGGEVDRKIKNQNKRIDRVLDKINNDKSRIDHIFNKLGAQLQ